MKDGSAPVTMFWSRGKAAAVALAAALMVGTTAVSGVWAQSDTTVYHGCKNKKSGQLRLVNGPGACKAKETPVSWDRQGAPGQPGADGKDGQPGAPGQDGRTVLSGDGPPADGRGADGDFYIDTTNDAIYGPKTQGGGWGAPTSLVGPRGEPGTNGTDGVDGEDGIDGKDGNTVLSGEEPPAAGLGSDGDFYIDTTGGAIYGPKAQGSWGQPISLVGPAGQDGENGSDGADGRDGIDGQDGKTVLSGAGAPADGLGNEGDFYIDTTTDAIYGPKTAGGWGESTSLIGPQGQQGLVWKGAWDAGTAYAKDDAVSHGGSSWLARRENTGVTPAEGDDWTLLAAKGETGTATGGTPNNESDTLVRRDAQGGFEAGAVGLEGKLTQTSDDGFVSSGEFNLFAEGIPAEGAGTRMMWDPRKAAFRAGQVTGTQWDGANIGSHSTAFGYNSRASGDYSFAAGNGATAANLNSVAIGGGNVATGAASVALGNGAHTDRRQGSFVFADRSITDYDPSTGEGYVRASANHQATFRVACGFRVFTSSNQSTGVAFGGASASDLGSSVCPTEHFGQSGTMIATSTGAYLSSSGTWTNASDVNRKHRFLEVDGEDVLARLRGMPISSWSYRVDGDGIRHMGPTAQDFRAAFGLGADSVSIATVDTDGVALAGVQALEERTARLQEENEEMKKKDEDLRQENEELRAELEGTQERQNELDRRLDALEAELDE